MERKKADESKIEPPHVIHLEYAIKPQEEHVRGGFVVEAPALRNLNRVKRVSWIFRSEKSLLCRQHMVMQSPEIPSCSAVRIRRSHRLTRNMEQRRISGRY